MMNKKIIVGIIAALLLVPIIPAAMAGLTLGVNTDKRYYQAGETVNITIRGPEGLVNYTIYKGLLPILDKTEVNIPESGFYNVTYDIPEEADVGLYNVVVESGLASAMTNFYVTKTSSEDLAEEYLIVAERAKNMTESTLEKLENTTLPLSVRENYEHGLDALEDANELIEEGKYEAAMGAANRAQVHFMNAVKIALNAAGDDDEIPPEDALLARIDRLNELILRLNSTLLDLEDVEQEDIDDISGLLEDAEVDLDSALAQVGVNNTLALDLIKDAQDKIKEAQKLLKDLTKEIKKQLMQRFMERLENRIQKLEEAVERIRNRLGTSKTNKMIGSLENRLRNVQRLRERLLQNQNIDIDELEAEIQGIIDDIDELKESEYGLLLKKMDKIHANIASLNDTIAYGLKKGWDIKELKNTIVEANRQMGEVFEMLGKDLREAVMDQLKETELELKGNPFGWIIGRRVWGK